VIDPSDYLFYGCYKSHCSIITESLKATEPDGSDVSLQQSITEWVDEYNSESTDKLTKATLEAVLYVANHLVLGRDYSHWFVKYSWDHIVLTV